MELMRLTPEEEKEIQDILTGYADTKEALLMKNFCQHGCVSTYDHVMFVTRTSYAINRQFHLNADVKSLVIGAFLHDFYLYDWHDNDASHRWHGFSHARTALKNASALFSLTKKEQDIIVHHMWPLNLTAVPRSREAFIVCLADKYCSTLETLTMRSAQQA